MIRSVMMMSLAEEVMVFEPELEEEELEFEPELEVEPPVAVPEVAGAPEPVVGVAVEPMGAGVRPPTALVSADITRQAGKERSN